MDRRLYTGYFREDCLPDWHCPSCGKGLLGVQAGTFFASYSSEMSKHEAFEPCWIEYRYACLLECSNGSCKDIVSSSGDGKLRECYEGERETGEPIVNHLRFFSPKYFQPHLQLIHLPEDVPCDVLDLLNESFMLFFSSPGAAANSVRASVEVLLTNLKVKRYDVRNRRRSPISLHRRIDLLAPRYDDLKDLLKAVKWLGNSGSHAGGCLSPDDVLDAYEMMEEILHVLYDGRKKKVKTLAKKINKRKGPKA